EHTDTDEGRMRPDMIVRMPDGREIVVDVKTPLDAYLSAVEASDDETRRKHLAHHARKVRERVRELSSKAYWTQFKNAPDFVILFIPGEQFLTAALDMDRELIEDALKQKVILTTPTSFVALLRAIAYGWRQESLSANAERIRDVGEELYGRLATFSEHLMKLGRSLNGAVADYNKTVGSYEAKLLPGARKFSEMGVGGDKALEEPERIDKAVRDVQQG
ncbi:MAG: DNA recombination protein RmuC, partial [Sulfuricaulis sp.]|nr:DNA recombination protein RmuC [Sulfuricaulis sp.]